MRRLGFVVVICCLLIAPVIAAQLKVDVALVNVVATITDETGHYVSDLAQDDLALHEQWCHRHRVKHGLQWELT